jgi:nucleoside-diphosphate-sugar epimerase
MTMQDEGSGAGPRVGLVGAGYIASFHLGAVRALGSAEVVGVCDLSASRARRFAEANGIPGHFTDIETMVRETGADAVHVLTPPNVHLAPGTAVLEAGADLLIEKPMCHTTEACEALAGAAVRSGRALGVAHNFLFSAPYEELHRDLEAGAFGELDLVEVVWNKELGQLKGGPFGAWMLADPRNILFEVAPHAFAHAVHLVGLPETVEVHPRDPVRLPRGGGFYRRWDILAYRGPTTVRIRLSFIPGYPEHYLTLRGLNGTARVDFENNTYTRQQHTPYLLDVDRFANTAAGARDQVLQATGTLANFVLSKAGLAKVGGAFPTSIARAVAAFYATRGGRIDRRLSPELGREAVALGELCAARVEPPSLPAPPAPARSDGGRARPAPPPGPPTVLVVGGTGFIGKALVRALASEAGKAVRVLSRNPTDLPAELAELGVDAVRGDFTDAGACRAALEGIRHVVHLARGAGDTWPEYLKSDVEPTRELAEAALDAGVERFLYASSIALYDAGVPGATITEETRPVPEMLRANPYARSKAENEANLLTLHRERGLPLVIVRPGVVLGPGGPPLHWGIAAWPHETVAKLYGDGNNPLPIVLVDDCARGMVAALFTPGIEGESFNLCGPPMLTANEYLDELEGRAGIRLTRVPVSTPQAYAEAVAKWAIKAAGGDRTALRPSLADHRGRTFASTFDCRKAETRLGWRPTADRGAVLAEAVHRPVDAFFR